MGAGMWNLGFGAILVVGGLTGKMTLIGTNSSLALTAVGAVMAGWGGWQMYRARKQ